MPSTVSDRPFSALYPSRFILQPGYRCLWTPLSSSCQIQVPGSDVQTASWTLRTGRGLSSRTPDPWEVTSFRSVCGALQLLFQKSRFLWNKDGPKVARN